MATSSVEDILSPHLDEDTIEYISALLNDEDQDEEDTKEAVEALISGTVEDEEVAEQIMQDLWREHTAGASCHSNGASSSQQSESVVEETTRRLDKVVLLKDKDETTYASGLRAASEVDREGNLVHRTDESEESGISHFYANMIGIPDKAVLSEKNRRKEKQRELRKKKDAEDLQTAIEQAIAIAAQGHDDDNNHDGTFTDGQDNHADVHLRGFNLPNKKGSGADLLVDAQLTLSRGRRYGLMGRNGCGKTTLMELVASRKIKGIPRNMTMLLVRQEIVGNHLTPVECVLKSDPRVQGLKMFIQMAENDPTSDATQLASAYERLTQIEEEEGPPEPRARKILHGLGFSEEMQEKSTKELSGGWRMRVSLANALFASPDLLLLDEPTNHLDLEAVLWLERYLATKFKGTCLVVSHDRHFLNKVVTDVVHFYREKLNTYHGDISNYEAVVEENRKRQMRLRENQEAKREHLQKYIDLHAMSGENGPKASRQRKSRMKKLDKLGTMSQEGKKYKASYDGPAQEVEEFKEDDTVELLFPDPGSFNGNIVSLDRATFGYTPDKILLKNIDLTIDISSRAALLGRNGCGKSTLIKLIVGALEPLKGKAGIDGRAKIEYLAQHQLEQLDPDGTPMGTLLERYPGDGGTAHKIEIRRYLANFGLGGDVLPLQKVHTMSGGQKCRLCLASAMYRKPHLLILDEPTNHLDLETTQALIESIRTFKGGVLLVSHDQHLLTSVCKDLYVVENGNLERLRHGMASAAFEAYKKAVVQGRR